jgi:hypothetical protein
VTHTNSIYTDRAAAKRTGFKMAIESEEIPEMIFSVQFKNYFRFIYLLIIIYTVMGFCGHPTTHIKNFTGYRHHFGQNCVIYRVIKMSLCT